MTTATDSPTARYVGRFAPSPTGPLHFGSLLAAVASYLETRAHGGQWLVRIEDIDPPREQAGASDAILTALERYGFEWDGPASYQSASHAAHAAAVETLLTANKAYRCGCSRRDLAAAPRSALGIIYPGTCRNGCDAEETAVRVLTDDEPIVFVDRLRMREVFQNLIDNAVKYRGDQPDPHIEIGCQQQAKEQVVYVRDNGRGIDPRYHRKVFELFHKLHAGDHGTGVGLAVVKRIVEVHGGRIWVESEGNGKGSTFYFTVPLPEA